MDYVISTEEIRRTETDPKTGTTDRKTEATGFLLNVLIKNIDFGKLTAIIRGEIHQIQIVVILFQFNWLAVIPQIIHSFIYLTQMFIKKVILITASQLS